MTTSDKTWRAWIRSISPRSLRGRIAVVFGVLLLSAGILAVRASWDAAMADGVAAISTPEVLWAVAMPVLTWIAVVGAAWLWVEVDVVQPLSVLEARARANARGEAAGAPTGSWGAPEEFSSLHRSLDALSKTLRGRDQRVEDALSVERALLREVNHRVRNNLQMVASILSIQGRSSSDELQARGYARAEERIHFLTLAHDRIYTSGDVREVRLDDLAAEIGRNLMSARGDLTRHIRLELALGPARTIDDNAVPMAFLIGESLSYAIDVACAAGAGSINMALQTELDGAIVFSLSSDDLVGPRVMPAGTQRMIHAFAGELGASIDHAASGSMLMHIRLPLGVQIAVA